MSKCLISVKCLSASCKRTFGSPGIFKEAQNQTFTTTKKKRKYADPPDSQRSAFIRAQNKAEPETLDFFDSCCAFDRKFYFSSF